ncbi:LysR substrate-binding domain-containing protein [Acidipila rosea]|uniref:DNA-binding transcriptional LysR family regulator n=1 Tax=Acidipila rosea TaxID=768535 RepID=A0A4R1L6M2_9BACT|nr:LysR substrate-binding domain-containing protein [Acidipila rosea]MBW4028672.1 LysR family transcriptional regulator [Acidobacteriota bacterium]MBW4043492.1 LysR family transcriptional regulator [Acidobacteriota bacterium]TCK73794.1 DNA-binding transcriptional LysR family regulator [Acidipila rosea]
MENFRLRVFRLVAETLNFRRAAEELHLTQPAVTAQIKALEDSLGIALFDRIGRSISLTPAGSTLLQYVRRIESITNEAVAALAPFGGQEGVDISIGASHTVAVYLLPQILPELLREWPTLHVHVVGGSTNEVLAALTNHQVSIGLIEAPAFRPDLKIEPFMEDELALIVRPDHKWAKKTLLRAAELVQEPILLREPGSGMRRFVEEYLERNGVLRKQLRTTVDVNSTEAIICAVEAGLGVGFVPWLALDKALKLGTINTVALENGPIKRQMSTALLTGPEPKGPVALLIQQLRSAAAQLKLKTPRFPRETAATARVEVAAN